MAGHSKFKNIQHRKGKQDIERAKIFTKLAREIVVAAKEAGGEIATNPKLRNAINNAKNLNMPKDRIDKALLQGSDSKDVSNYFRNTYEVFFSGVALIIETLTDNKNRTISEIRSLINNRGGTFAEPGSVLFMFNKFGIIRYPLSVADNDTMLEASIVSGANDIKFTEDQYVIYVNPESLANSTQILTNQFNAPNSANFEWIAKDVIILENESLAIKLLKLLSVLEDNDDVQNIFVNCTLHNQLREKFEEEISDLSINI